jgi:hypothetical protein
VTRAGSGALRLLLALAVLAIPLLVVERLALGVPLGSDAYSYLAWARGAIHHGITDHPQFDYTVPKPLELGVATVAELVRAPLAVFGWWTIFGALAAVAAAAALGGRLGGRRAALIAAVLAAALPVLWRGALAGDANVPYAACVVGAASAGAATLPASLLLFVGGLLRPEAWGIAVLSLLLGFRQATPRERVAALAAAVLPPAVWLGLDRLLTGDWLYSTHVVDRYVERFSPPALSVRGLPDALLDQAQRVVGWPLAVAGVVALVAGLRRRPLDPAVVYPVALLAALAVEVSRNQVSQADVARMLVALALFAAVGAAVLLDLAPPVAVAAAGAAVAIAFCVPPLADAVRRANAQAVRASELERPIGPAAARGPGIVLIDRRWQGALAIYGPLDRRIVYPTQARPTELPGGPKASVLAAGAPRPAGAGDPVRSRHWAYWPPRSP